MRDLLLVVGFGIYVVVVIWGFESDYALDFDCPNGNIEMIEVINSAGLRIR